jgi:hypothetical protein
MEDKDYTLLVLSLGLFLLVGLLFHYSACGDGSGMRTRIEY